MREFFATVVEVLSRIRSGIALSNSRLEAACAAVTEQAERASQFSTDTLKQQFTELRTRHESGASFSDLATDAFALIREAASRALKLYPYDVQIQAALALNDGKCVEMQTGEGKTLAAALVVCLRAISGSGVHVLTFNDYLAERDAAWMKPLYDFFGFSVGHVIQGMSPESRRQAYLCDITYVTAREAGFDFLRDQLC